eukprot:gb/GEZN01024216.1/.p1 GENE.gb/GEZN01024216.1/~~gb/GEZN01024216.1/.p1  ORF type:complete len:116 (-),score=14.14 gb/GEZN01024216.1/:226-552(-)
MNPFMTSLFGLDPSSIQSQLVSNNPSPLPNFSSLKKKSKTKARTGRMDSGEDRRPGALRDADPTYVSPEQPKGFSQRLSVSAGKLAVSRGSGSSGGGWRTRTSRLSTR